MDCSSSKKFVIRLVSSVVFALTLPGCLVSPDDEDLEALEEHGWVDAHDDAVPFADENGISSPMVEEQNYVWKPDTIDTCNPGGCSQIFCCPP